MKQQLTALLLMMGLGFLDQPAAAQQYGPPDRGQPGDRMIQNYLEQETAKIHAKFLTNVESIEDWTKLREQYKQQYLHMLGLWPLQEKTPLQATVTGTFRGDGFVVEKLHYQSRPQLYVTANLYRPERGERLPGVLYVCGHSSRGRNGSKTAYQSHGIWFARHGYICLIVDTLQLGEIAALHHGTYREDRWWWHSRGYTPAGVECWNGVRGIDYLVSRPDVDPERIAVTGISGGGAATYWISSADERVKVAVPISGMADLSSYIPNRVINGHCDCMFLYNTFRWPWTRIAALIAPRPQLFVNSDQDRIFPMDANERVINRLERLYSLYGVGEQVDSIVSIGGHAYRRDIRRATFRFINIHLKNDPRPVTDSEIDLVSGPRNNRLHPIPPQQLRVFPTDADLPTDELNTTIDEHFVPLALVKTPKKGEFNSWKKTLLAELRRVTFGSLPERIPAAKLVKKAKESSIVQIETEPGIHVPLSSLSTQKPTGNSKRVLLLVQDSNAPQGLPEWVKSIVQPGDAVYQLQPRGIGSTRWTRKNPPNTVRRSHVLIGRTIETGRVRDVIAAARFLHNRLKGNVPVHVVGENASGVIAAYAALWEPEISGVVLNSPLLTHMDSRTPQFLNVLRVCDVPDVLGMLAPRRLTVHGQSEGELQKTSEIYAAAGAPNNLTITPPAACP